MPQVYIPNRIFQIQIEIYFILQMSESLLFGGGAQTQWSEELYSSAFQLTFSQHTDNILQQKKNKSGVNIWNFDVLRVRSHTVRNYDVCLHRTKRT